MTLILLHSTKATRIFNPGRTRKMFKQCRRMVISQQPNVSLDKLNHLIRIKMRPRQLQPSRWIRRVTPCDPKKGVPTPVGNSVAFWFIYFKSMLLNPPAADTVSVQNLLAHNQLVAPEPARDFPSW